MTPQSTRAAFVGIDVACAKRKRLPIVVCERVDGALTPLQLRSRGLPLPPSGMGNASSIDVEVVMRFAEDAAGYLQEIERRFEVEIKRIAIDAPSEPKLDGEDRRASETALDRRRISCFTTPDASEWSRIREKVRAHLDAGGEHSRIPHANQLWMLVGFALFRTLRSYWPCIEIFPHAIAHALGEGTAKKSLANGLSRQLAAVSRRAGWPPAATKIPLRSAGYGASHDLLDAYLAAWVASLPDEEIEPLGHPPHDVIWIPRTPDRPTID